ncbi:MAG: AarF/ABC1/UbiB kinase family protein [Pseudomonadota bacterium]
MNDQSQDPNTGRAVPSGRLTRLARLGGMASGIAGSMALEGARQFGRGARPEARDLLLTPANVTRLTEELARMRGAAMKLGQLVSMDAGDVLPPELATIMARLREAAEPMPPRQLRRVLDAAWGTNWLPSFAHFDPRPIAAASIGQVHRAKTRDGHDLAIKVQYPGVAASIDSDVANLGVLIRMSGLLPKGLALAPLLEEVRRQLHEEADYRREAEMLSRFGAFVAGDPNYHVPRPFPKLSTDTVLAMEYVPGLPIEDAATLPQARRNQIMTKLADLFLREVFQYGLIQSDPNFANYRFDPETDKLVLLDFGAARTVPGDIAQGYRTLLVSGLSGNKAGMEGAAIALGFFAEDTMTRHKRIVLDMVRTVFDALTIGASFDFGDTALTDRLRAQGMVLAAERDFVHVPPVDTLFLQRKVGGLFLLGARLRAHVPISDLLERHLGLLAEPVLAR